MSAVKIFYLSSKAYKGSHLRIAQLLKNLSRIIYACDIAYQVEIGNGLNLPHQGLGVVIGPGVKIGKNCTIYSNVVLGDKHGIDGNGYPIIGDNVTIGAGAIILGNLKIAENSVIGANSVVIKDIPKNAVAVGNPAKIIRIEGESK